MHDSKLLKEWGVRISIAIVLVIAISFNLFMVYMGIGCLIYFFRMKSMSIGILGFVLIIAALGLTWCWMEVLYFI